MITAGIDCGAKNTRTIIMKDGQIVGRGKVLTGFDQNQAVMASWEAALKDAGLEAGDEERTCGTGSGKECIRNAGLVNDIRAMAKGANYFFPKARTVADVGAEETRAVRMDADGSVVDFAVNEKCAAGAGDHMARVKLTINGRAIEAPDDAAILEAAEVPDIYIPVRPVLHLRWSGSPCHRAFLGLRPQTLHGERARFTCNVGCRY